MHPPDLYLCPRNTQLRQPQCKAHSHGMLEPAIPLKVPGGSQFEISHCNDVKAVSSVASCDDEGAGDPID